MASKPATVDAEARQLAHEPVVLVEVGHVRQEPCDDEQVVVVRAPHERAQCLLVGQLVGRRVVGIRDLEVQRARAEVGDVVHRPGGDLRRLAG